MTATIYSTSWCPYCDAAKRLLAAKGVGFDEIDIEQWHSPRKQLQALTGRRTVPRS